MSVYEFETLVGDVVWWYPRGDVNREPTPLVVNGVDKTGIVTGMAFPKNAMMPQRVNGARHVTDQWAADHPDYVKEAGLWDWRSKPKPPVEKKPQPQTQKA